MKKVRQFIVWATPVALLLFAVLSVVGAFLGADRASRLFSSPLLVVFWVVLIVLLAAGVSTFRKLRKSPALLAIHVGVLCILIGGMYGSETAHQLRRQIGGSHKINSGYVVIHEGGTSRRVLGDSLKEEKGRLPFSLKLKDFRLERYEMEGEPWKLLVKAPVAGSVGGQSDGEYNRNSDEGYQQETVQKVVDCEAGAILKVAKAGIRVEVLEYLPSATPVYPDGGGGELQLEVRSGRTSLRAEKGATAELENPPVTVRVDRVYQNLQVRGQGQGRQIVDVPEKGDNRALKVKVIPEKGEEQSVYLISGYPMHGESIEGLRMSYVTFEPTGARSTESDEGRPALRVRVVREGEEVAGKMTRWLIVGEEASHARLSLSDLYPEEEGAGKGVPTGLYLLSPSGPPKTYRSQLVVMEEGDPVVEKAVEVNDPLHYGGYHFYQSSYDEKGDRYMVLLKMKSDSGLWVVYAGFALLVLGVISDFWVNPVLSRVTKREK